MNSLITRRSLYLITRNVHSTRWCIPTGDVQTAESGRTFVGSGDPQACLDLLGELVVYKVNDRRRCPSQQCVIGAVYQPPLPEHLQFEAIGAFIYTLPTIGALNDDGLFVPEIGYQKAFEFCELVMVMRRRSIACRGWLWWIFVFQSSNFDERIFIFYCTESRVKITSKWFKCNCEICRTIFLFSTQSQLWNMVCATHDVFFKRKCFNCFCACVNCVHANFSWLYQAWQDSLIWCFFLQTFIDWCANEQTKWWCWWYRHEKFAAYSATCVNGHNAVVCVCFDLAVRGSIGGSQWSRTQVRHRPMSGSALHPAAAQSRPRIQHKLKHHPRAWKHRWTKTRQVICDLLWRVQSDVTELNQTDVYVWRTDQWASSNALQ